MAPPNQSIARLPLGSTQQRTLGELRAFARLLTKRAQLARVAQTASSLAFLSLLALVPMVAIAFAVLTVLPAFSDLRGALESGNLNSMKMRAIYDAPAPAALDHHPNGRACHDVEIVAFDDPVEPTRLTVVE